MRVMFAGNYLRVRGEYSEETLIDAAKRELPPRARRIHQADNHTRHLHGTTSACAENTAASFACIMAVWNYLRVRGEYYPTATRLYGAWELPPRARRIPGITPKHNPSTGTTSACAENTWVSWVPGRLSWNYLRVRGEYIVLFTIKTPHGELPPRARRIRRKY